MKDLNSERLQSIRTAARWMVLLPISACAYTSNILDHSVSINVFGKVMVSESFILFAMSLVCEILIQSIKDGTRIFLDFGKCSGDYAIPKTISSMGLISGGIIILIYICINVFFPTLIDPVKIHNANEAINTVENYLSPLYTIIKIEYVGTISGTNPSLPTQIVWHVKIKTEASTPFNGCKQYYQFDTLVSSIDAKITQT